MLKVSNSVLIAISTHSGEDNYYSRLMTDPDPVMDRLFVRLRVDLVCDSCKSLGRAPSECTHQAHMNPAWLLGSNEDRVKKLIGDEETYAREVMGAFMSNSGTVFRAEWLKFAEERPPRSLDDIQDAFLFSMIDPAGGGSSRTAVVTIMRDGDGEVVLIGAAEAVINEGPQLRAWCNVYFSHFENDPILRSLPHWVACERNYGGCILAATFVQAACAAVPSGRILEHCTEEAKHGTWTCAEVNKTGTLSLMFELHDHRVSFAPFLVVDRELGAIGSTEHRPVVDDAVDPAPHDLAFASYQKHAGGLKTVLLQQLSQFRKVFKKSGSWSYTGKDGKGGRDDMAMCLVMAVYHSVVRAVRIAETVAST
jgi:hypothetical protein